MSYPNGPANGGRNPNTLTPPDQLGGTSDKAVTVIDNVGVSAGAINPPAADFGLHQTPPGKSVPATSGSYT